MKNYDVRLIERAKEEYYCDMGDSFFCTRSKWYKRMRIVTFVFAIINLIFNLVMCFGTALIAADEGTKGYFSAFTVSLVLTAAGLIFYKFSKTAAGGIIMAAALPVRYFATYNKTAGGPFDFAVEKGTETALSNTLARLFEHFIPMVILFLLCAYAVAVYFYERAKISARYNKISAVVYSMKKQDGMSFTPKEWDECVEKYLSGEYKNFKKPKKSLRAREKKENNKNI